ncbi:MAG: response regulator [Candidatus Omnitrophica bacterium]|nr:response regulator [Candidatus Omnitrophota bacterium]
MKNKILVVDDEAVARNLLVDMLSDEGYDVITAVDGEEGLQKASSELTDLIILDLLMPKIAGGTLAAKLRADKKTSHIPILFLTGMINKDEADLMCNQLSCELLLTKPFNRDELLTMVARAIRKEK